ncbi:MAG: hypothetical protein JHC26_03720 [Thermofilum sp.]|uniref:hypothetical protein n=1 Tax=Thermofilum sp. TaxID=1961369 RepID=UPI0025892101|nr:hypothetical protein [Thermofilum sp.]MCI4408176.1 hypothetical protein [Thermofilum sp.]
MSELEFWTKIKKRARAMTVFSLFLILASFTVNDYETLSCVLKCGGAFGLAGAFTLGGVAEGKIEEIKWKSRNRGQDAK